MHPNRPVIRNFQIVASGRWPAPSRLRPIFIHVVVVWTQYGARRPRPSLPADRLQRKNEFFDRRAVDARRRLYFIISARQRKEWHAVGMGFCGRRANRKPSKNDSVWLLLSNDAHRWRRRAREKDSRHRCRCRSEHAAWMLGYLFIYLFFIHQHRYNLIQ